MVVVGSVEKAKDAVLDKEAVLHKLQEDLADAKVHLDKLARDLAKAKQDLKYKRAFHAGVVREIKNDLA